MSQEQTTTSTAPAPTVDPAQGGQRALMGLAAVVLPITAFLLSFDTATRQEFVIELSGRERRVAFADIAYLIRVPRPGPSMPGLKTIHVPASVMVSLACPDKVDFPGAFILRARFLLTLWGGSMIRPSLNGMTNADIEHVIWSSVMRSPPMVRLNLAGAIVEPDGVRDMRSDGTVSWSISLPKAQRYMGEIELIRARTSYPVESQYINEALIDWPRGFVFDFEARESVTSRFWKWVVGFLGTLATLPGIMAFIKDRKCLSDEPGSAEPLVIQPGDPDFRIPKSEGL